MDSTTPINVTPVVVKTKAPKKPSLNVKYSRFLAFGHWFLSSQAELISEEVRGQLFQKLMIFGSVEEQTAFYEGFFGEIKETNKSIRKLVAASKKPVKAPKAPRAKKSKAVLPQDGLVAQLIADAAESGVAVEATASEAPKKEKKPRAKKVKAPAAAPGDAGADAPADALTEAAAADAAPVKEKKPRAKKAKATETVAATEAATVVEPVTAELVTEAATEPVVEPVTEAATETVAPVTVTVEPVAAAKEKKPRAKKADGDKPKKTKKADPVVEPVVAAAEESEDVQTRVVTIEGQEFLIDEEFNLYETKEPYAQVGKYDQASEKAIFE